MTKIHQVTPSPQEELEVKLEERNGKHKLELEFKWREGQEFQGLKIDNFKNPYKEVQHFFIRAFCHSV